MSQDVQRISNQVLFKADLTFFSQRRSTALQNLSIFRYQNLKFCTYVLKIVIIFLYGSYVRFHYLKTVYYILNFYFNSINLNTVTA
jgi:hypothetical protein